MTAPDADFRAAQRRHWEDAEFLFAKGRWPNADQLYGFSAECGLKAIMVGEGMMSIDDTTGKPAQKFRKHIDIFWQIFCDHMGDRREDHMGGRREWAYLRQLPGGEPFADWSTDDRYASGECFDENRVKQRREATWQIASMFRSYEENKS